MNLSKNGYEVKLSMQGMQDNHGNTLLFTYERNQINQIILNSEDETNILSSIKRSEDSFNL